MTRTRTFILSLLLTLPVILFLVHHYTNHSPELHPTGFTADENVLYMSYAHQYIDQGNASLFYSNPFDGDPQSPKIYFQPVNFLFVPFLKMGADPGLVFSLFGLLMAFCCIYLGVRIIQHLLPDNKNQVLVTILFTWGGGLTALTGVGSSLLTGLPLSSWIDGIYVADPANGWWGMNWGRTLFIPLEAYYHFLFLLNIYFILKHKWTAAIAAAAFLSLSHPFTGIEFLLITIGWLVLEKIIFRNKKIPYWYLAGIVAITVFHGWYYLYYLNSFPEHKQIFSQYSAGWTYSFRIFIPAYILVLVLSFITFYKNRSIPKFLSESHQRLFLCWAIIAFLLSKHEWFIKPMQPIHFTRGYVWAGLFLLGLPGLVWLAEYSRKKTAWKICFAVFIFLFLLDNTLWTGNHLRDKNKTEWEGYLTKDTKAVFTFLNKSTSRDDLLVGNAPLINYMANAYAPVNTWASHPYNTPNRSGRVEVMKHFLETGIRPPEWANRRLILVVNKKEQSLPIHASLQVNKIFENDTYIIFIP
ncbi:MAG: hypothetical protein ABL876_06690 [Chitinophagaceae bacterium]